MEHQRWEWENKFKIARINPEVHGCSVFWFFTIKISASDWKE